MDLVGVFERKWFLRQPFGVQKPSTHVTHVARVTQDFTVVSECVGKESTEMHRATLDATLLVGIMEQQKLRTFVRFGSFR